MHLLQNVFLTICLSYSVCATAQIPGYMGKRLVIDAEIQTFPALASPTSKGNQLFENNGQFALHGRYGLGASYVVSRDHMIQGHIHYFQTGMNVKMWTPPHFPLGPRIEHLLLNVLTGLNFDLAYSHSDISKGHISPYGKHRAYHLFMTRVNGNNNLYQSGQLIDNQLFGNIDAKINIFGLGYSVTRNYMISDQFLLNFGWQFNFSSGLRDLTSPENSITTDYKADNLASFKTHARRKMIVYNAMQFKIGIGFLK